MKISFDRDDVLFPFTDVFLLWHNEVYCTNFTVIDNTTYDLSLLFRCDYSEALRRTAEYCNTEKFRNTQPLEGSQELVNLLIEKGHELIVITSKVKIHGEVDLEEATNSFMGRYFQGQFSKIFMTGQMDGGKVTKGMICNQERVDLHVEDHIEYAKECVAPNRTVCLFDRPWNQCSELPSGIVRVYSLSEIVNYLN